MGRCELGQAWDSNYLQFYGFRGLGFMDLRVQGLGFLVSRVWGL